MRKIILALAVSLDGFIEGPGGEYDWCFTDGDYGMREFLNRIDTIFVGRKTYEMTLGHKGVGFNKMKQYVFSNTLDKVTKGSSLLNGEIMQKVKKIKDGPGKDIWLFGGASLTTSLMNLELVDEISLAVHPIILGSGKPLFSNVRDRVYLNHTHSKTYSSGLVSLTYCIKSEK